MELREEPRTSVVVASDQRLVGETLCAALGSRGLRTDLLLGWPPRPIAVIPRSRRPDQGPHLLLMICDLGTPARLEEAQAVGMSRALPWLVLTTTSRGAAWGAMLVSGASAVLGADIGLDDLVAALEKLIVGDTPMPDAERQALIRDWRAADRGIPEQLKRPLADLDEHEQEVLIMLHDGSTLRTIAEHFGVSEAALRGQVQKMLRRLALGAEVGAPDA